MDTLSFLYHTPAGRALLKPLTSRGVSRVCGRFLDSGVSKVLIPGFRRRAHIDPEEFDLSQIRSFNDFFDRPLRPGMRSFALEGNALMSPCDGLLTAVPIREGTVLPVKQSRYTVERLLGDAALAREFRDGVCLVYRLCVEHYHRYCWFDSGVKEANVFLPGALHTVRPVALADVPVFAENCREYAVLHSDHFGLAVQMEVGALLVGKIVNDLPGPGRVERAEEKGRFAFGGSTILVLLQKDAAVLNEEILRASERGEETPVKLGQAVGLAP